MWRKFFLSTIGMFLLMCFSSAAFNFAVDPYNVWQSNRTLGFNFFADISQHHERLFKAVALINQRPNVVVIGNSKADFAIDPQLFGERAYNASVRNAQPKELLAFARAAVRSNPNLERLIVVVDYEMFAIDRESMTGFDPEQLSADRITVKNFFATLLTTDALADSLSTIKFNRIMQRDFPAFDPDGKFSEPALYELFTFENSFTRNSIEMTHWAPVDPIVVERKFEDFNAIVKLCRDHAIELTVVILPVSRYHFERYPSERYRLWQKKLTSLAPVHDFASIFMNASTIDDEKNFWDAAHVKARAFEDYICPMLK